jgi:spermidine synthase
VLLGMVSPYIIRVKIARRDIHAENSGAVIGRFTALSTIGSILGTFLGGYVLISLLGTRLLLFCVAAALLIAALLLFLPPDGKKGAQAKTPAEKNARGGNDGEEKRKRRVRVAAVFPALLVCAGGAAETVLGGGLEGVVEVDTRYNHILIVDRNVYDARYRLLITDPGKSQSYVRLDQPDELAAAYTRHFSLTEMYQPRPERVLMLGGGGYAVPRRLLYEADRDPARPPRRPLRVDVVEIDPGMTDVARRFFFLKDDPRLNIHHEDARVFLNRRAVPDAEERYDVILLDTFNSHYAIPFHLCTVEAMRKVHDLLTDTGVAAMNIIGSFNGDTGRLFRAIHAGVSEVFPEVRVFAVSGKNPDIVQNIILLAAKSPPVPGGHPLAEWEYSFTPSGDVPALTDDFAPVERYAIYD